MGEKYEDNKSKKKVDYSVIKKQIVEISGIEPQTLPKDEARRLCEDTLQKILPNIERNDIMSKRASEGTSLLRRLPAA